MSTLLLAFLELTFVMVFIMLLHSIKRSVGNPAFYLSLGMFFVLGQVISAFGIQINPGVAGLQVDVGNVVLLSPFLVALLIVYVIDGTLEAQRMILGFLAIIFAYYYLASLTATQCLWPGYFSRDPDFIYYLASSFLAGRRVAIASFAAIAIDLFTIPIIYQFFRNRRFSLFVCVLSTLVFGQVIDSFVFQLFDIPRYGDWWSELRSSYIAKALAMTWLSFLTTFYLHMWRLYHQERRRPLDIILAFLGAYGRAEQLQKHLREWEGRYRIVVEHSSEWIFIVDADGNVLNANPRGMQWLETAPASWTDFGAAFRYPDGYNCNWKDVWRRLNAVEHEQALLQDWVTESPKGGTVFLETQISMGEMSEKPIAIVIARDVTERRRMEDERQQLQEQLMHSQRLQAVGQLAGGVAHDFNNLLHTIQGSVDALNKQPRSSEAQRGMLGNISEALSRASLLTNQLLGFARRGQYRQERIEVTSLLDEVRRLFEPAAGKGTLLKIATAPEPMYLYGDDTQLVQVLLNILINARDAVQGQSGPRIVFRAEIAAAFTPGWNRRPENLNHRAPEQFICIRVKDNGCGIPADIREKIFEPFFTTKDVGKGTGMGLAMAYGCIANHGGWVHVESEEAKGTEFFVYLPRK